jgi:FemAB-related protein (PEP-CTERM system-associated)
MIISSAADHEMVEWNKFVSLHILSGHYYDWKWGSIFKDCFGHRSYRFVARDGPQIRGVLTLVEIRSPITGSSLISMPYLNGGGILASNIVAVSMLASQAECARRSSGSAVLELRHRGNELGLQLGWPSRSHKVAMLLPLKSDPESLFASFGGKLRSQIRRSGKAGFVMQFARGNSFHRKELDGFYDVFACNMLRLGTPVYPISLFEHTLREFGLSAGLFTVWLKRKCVAGAITVGSGAVVEVPWASSLYEYTNLAVNMGLYWDVLRRSCLDGYTTFDFGRSTPGSGTYYFKKQWGAEPLELHWSYQLAPGARQPDRDPRSPRYRLATKVWQRLPIAATRTLGPWLTRWLP